MFPMSLVCGNTMVMKPSEKDPGACMMLVELAKEAGIPDGCVNVIHGAHKGDKRQEMCCVAHRNVIQFRPVLAVDFICEHPAIRAISFVGSDQAGQYIYEKGSKNGKRVQSNMGAKNHGVIMPDANKEASLNQVLFDTMCYQTIA